MSPEQPDPTPDPTTEPRPGERAGTARQRVRRVVRGGGGVTEVEGPQRARVRSSAEDTARPAHAEPGPEPFGDDAVLLDARGQQLDPATARGGQPLPPGVTAEGDISASRALAEAARAYLEHVDREGPEDETTLRRRSRLRDTLAWFDQVAGPGGDTPQR